jgi:hypothetical protein
MLTEFEMESPEMEKNLTTDALTIPVFLASHINRQWEGATTSDTSPPETNVLLERENIHKVRR